MKIRSILSFLEMKAPGFLQESYDNSGLLVGNPDQDSTGVLISLDCTEEVLDEAIALGVNTIISHHPIVFSGLKRFTGRTYVERVVMKAIKHDLQLISFHTNLDNVSQGVNKKIADRLGLQHTRILAPKEDMLCKVVIYAPQAHADQVRQAMFDAGAGQIGDYDACSFNLDGKGTFRAGANSQPYVGEKGKVHHEAEVRIESIVPKAFYKKVIDHVKTVHPYEVMAYDVLPLMNAWSEMGSGMIGEISTPMFANDFALYVKKNLRASVVKMTKDTGNEIRKVAVCGGSGRFLLEQAIGSGADVFISSDFKYHEYFDALGRIVVMDIGHFETEQFTIDLISDWFAEKFATFATHKSGVVTNPINYL